MAPRDEESLAVDLLAAALPHPRPRHPWPCAKRCREARGARREQCEFVRSLVDEVDGDAVDPAQARMARARPIVERRRYPAVLDMPALVTESEEPWHHASASERADAEVVRRPGEALDVDCGGVVEAQLSDNTVGPHQSSAAVHSCARHRAADAHDDGGDGDRSGRVLPPIWHGVILWRTRRAAQA